MAQTIKLKRSATPGAIPSIESLELGEIAINTYDGKVYIKKDDGTSPDTIVEVSGTGGLASGDFSFLDNEKAIFGTGSDLQIFHDGSHSYITDTGTGDLRINGASNVDIRDTTGVKMFRGVSGGEAILYHNNSQKIATTATGIDVTGSVTADGLTVNVSADSDSVATITSSATANNTQLRLGTNGDDSVISGSGGSNGALAFKVYGSERMRIDSNGYLAIGTSSTGFNGQGLPLVVGSGTGNTGMTIFSGADSYGTLQFADAATTGAASYAGVVSYNHTDNFMYFSTASTERMRIDASGNVGIGVTSLTNGDKLTVNGNINLNGKLFNGTSNNSTGLDFTSNYVNYHGYAGHRFYAQATSIGSMAERMSITVDGKVIISDSGSARANYGTNQTPQLQVEGTNSETGAIGVVRNSADTNPSYLYLGKTRSATNGVSAPTIVQDNDNVGSVVFTASDGVVLQNVARISALVDGTPTAGTVPGELLFYVGDNGTDLAFRIEASSNATFAGDVTVSGDLFVTGASTSVNVEDLNVEQGEITLNYGTGDTSAAANGAGIRIQDAVDASTDATILWNTTSDKFEFSHGIISAGPITGSNLSGTNTGDETQASINALAITEVGTITSGTWNGGVIAEAYLQNQSGTNTGDEPAASSSAAGVVTTGTQTFAGNKTFTGTIKAPAYKEEVGISSTTSGIFNIDVYDNSVLLLDTAMTANWTINVRGTNIFPLNSVLAVGESITVVCLATQGVTPYYNIVMQIDSVTQTVKWQGGTAPTAGNASSVDSYSYTIIKTASSTYTVLGNLTQFA